MSNYTFDDELISDLHKDAYGSRPGEIFWSWWKEASNDERQKTWNSLLLSLEESIAEDSERLEASCREFEEEVQKFMSTGGVNWSTAVRWIMEASEWGDYGFVDFLGLEFGICCDKAIQKYQARLADCGGA